MLCHKDLKVEAPSLGSQMDKAEHSSWFGVGIVFREGSGPKPVYSMTKAQEGWALHLAQNIVSRDCETLM